MEHRADEHRVDLRTAICNEYRAMVKTTSLGKITVSDLCERVGISRKTFYTYFESRDDLLTCIVRDDVVEPVKRLYPLFGRSNPTVSVPLLHKMTYQSIYEHKDFYVRLITQNEERIFVRALKHALDDAHAFVRELGGAPKDEAYDYASSFLMGAQAEIVVRWIRGGMAVSPETLGSWFEVWGDPAILAVAGK